MLIKRLDKWVRQSVYAVHVSTQERRCGIERRKANDRRSETRVGAKALDRRQRAERRESQDWMDPLH